MYGGNIYKTITGEGRSPTATNFRDSSSSEFPNGTITWDNLVTSVGFYITTNDSDDLNITASFLSNGTTVGTHSFITGGVGSGGSFVGIEFLNGFDMGCLKIRILGVFISPIFGPIDHARIYFLAKFYF